MRRVVRRTLARAIFREELWNGNRERPREWLDPEHPMRWAWSQHAGRRARYEQWCRDEHARHLQVVRLRSPAATRRWLAGLPLAGS